jgi:diguanylate cyclase (GGDEF)-like protein
MLKRLPRTLHLAAWLGLGLLPLAGMLLAIHQLSDRHLAQDAQHSAQSWARHLATNVPDIDLVFLGDLPSSKAQDQLTSLRGMAGLFHYRLFDPAGKLVLVSDSIGNAPPAESLTLAAPATSLAGSPRVRIKHGDGQSLPSVYSEAVVPVMHGRALIGVMELHVDQTERAAITADSFGLAAAVSGLALGSMLSLGLWLWRRRAAQQTAAEARLHYVARHDMLTGTFNRNSFHQALAKACADTRPGGPGLAVLHVDVDRFKEINDSHGHAAGDALLHAVSQRLAAVLRGGDVLARLGADRFAVLQGGVLASSDVTHLAQRVLHAMQPPYLLPGGAELVVTVCVGAALHGTDGDAPETLSQRAEQALLRAKVQGQASYSLYDAALDQALQDRRTLTIDLRQALAQGGLQLHYQPLFNADGRRLQGYEALARWPHPTRGFVPPSDFIALAEQSGLIDELGRWVLHTACREAARWSGALTVAVNLSPAQFKREGAVVEEVQAALAASGLPASRLELEITESLLMGDTEEVLRALMALQALGVRIAMDDFGTGFSSLSYLWRFPFDKVKIDRAFTQRLGRDDKVDLIVRSIISLAHSLAMRVNAEGVETEAQYETLRRHGCDELQGFLLGRPQPPVRLAHLEAGLTPAAMAA